MFVAFLSSLLPRYCAEGILILLAVPTVTAAAAAAATNIG